MLFYLSQGLILGGTAAAQPGPLLAYLLSQTISNGWRRTLPAAFAPLISDVPIILLVLVILTRTPYWSLQPLRVVGGLFLLYLAYGACRSYKTATTPSAVPAQSTHKGVLNAALMNLLSPYPYIFWATIAGPITIAGWKESPRNGVSFIFGFYVTLIGGFMAFIVMFALTNRLDARLSRFLSAVSAVVLLFFGLYQIWLGIIQW